VYWGKPYQHTLRDLIEDAGGSVADLCKFIEYRGAASTEIKLLTTHNTVNLYFNNISDATYFINTFNKGDGCRGYYRIKNPMVESGVIYLQKPHGTHRLYFKFTRIFDQTIADLCKFIDEYSATPCYTLETGIRVWKNFQSHAFTLNSGNFIDVPSEHVATIFALKFNSMLSKVSIIKDRKMINNINSEFPDGTNI
jgi:hypothetical protein